MTINTVGNSLVNVYYDRNLVTLNFQVYGYTYTPTTGNGGTQYGYYNGEYVQLYYNDGTWYRTRTGNWWNYNYSNPYNGTRYTRSDNQSWHDYIEPMTGLYGSSLPSNGYTWPTDLWWYDDYDYYNGYGYYGTGTRTTFLDAFKLADDGDSETFYGFTGSGTNSIHFLKQDPDNEAVFTEANVVTSSAGTFYISDKYNGYKAITYSTNNSTWTQLGDKDPSTGYYATVSDYTNLYIRYAPLKYNIIFMDGVYVNGNGASLGLENQGQWKVDENIVFESDIAAYNKGGAKYYVPSDERVRDGFVFAGWYVDDQCTQPYTFGKMPEGLKVYAKWQQIQYRVFLHPNVPESDTTLDWGSEDQAMNFRVAYGDEVSLPYGTRTTGFEFMAWYTDPGLSNLFDGEAYPLNETTVTTPYDKTDLTDVMNKWGNIESGSPTPDGETGPGYNSDKWAYNETTGTFTARDRYWITKKLDLYASWRETVPGALGIGIIYNAGEGTNPPKDTTLYLDKSGAIAQGASTAPQNKQFLYWVVQKWNGTEYVDTDVHVYPGDSFKVLKADAKAEQIAETTEAIYMSYTVQVRAQYGELETPTDTHIEWYRNWDANDTAETGLLHKDEGLQINEAVDIYTLTAGLPKRVGYKFLGWARKAERNASDQIIPYYEGLGENDLYLIWNEEAAQYEIADGTKVTQVAADEVLPYQAFYAVWEYVGVFYVFHSSDATVDIIDMADKTLFDANGKYDLTAAVKEGYLYGGYFDHYLNLTDAQCIAVAGKGTAATDNTYDGSALRVKIGDTSYRYWTKGFAYTESGETLAPTVNAVYYLRELSEDYLGLSIQAVYDWSNGNKIDDLYLITTTDNNIFQEAGFKITTDQKAAFYASLTIQSRNSDKTTKVTAKSINGIGGYVAYWLGTKTLLTDAAENSEFTVLPYWITLDGVRVDDKHPARTFNIGNKTYGKSGGMYEVVESTEP